MPIGLDDVYAGTMQSVSGQTEDIDDSKQTVEHIYINYARKEKRVKIERYTRVTERIAADRAAAFYILEFNDTGLLSETIKRDYSGEGDPLHI